MAFDDEVRENLLRLNAEALAYNLLLTALLRRLALGGQGALAEEAINDAEQIIESLAFGENGPANHDQVTRAAKTLEKVRGAMKD